MRYRGIKASIQSFLHDVKSGGGERLVDKALLERYVDEGDEAAFAALVSRHGPAVLAVCLRVLRDEHAADDAFQATFLALAKQAAVIRRQEAVGAWLYEVAYHAAIRARTRLIRSRQVEQAAGRTEPTSAG